LSYRAKLFAFLLAALAVLFVSNVAYSAHATFQQLRAIEADRDRWQRPADVIQALDLKPGDVAVDLGCGSGYFTLKLSPSVGPRGRVVAEDIRRLPLTFLWFRAAARRDHNVDVTVGAADDPHLPARVNAVLISNTYHEFSDPHSILVHVYNSLVSGGRLVIIDRQPKLPKSPAVDVGDHEISAQLVENDLRRTNFEIVTEQDNFVPQDSYGETWWLITARKPQ
jgi:predicted methyltransferase